MPIYGVGSLTFSTFNEQNLCLPNVYFVPQLAANLISVGQLVKNDYTVHFSSFGCVVQDQKTRKVIGKGCKQGRLFLLDTSLPISFLASSNLHLQNRSLMLWHRHLGQLNNASLLSLCRQNLIFNKNCNFSLDKCVACCSTKTTKLSFSLSTPHSTAPFDLIHSDIRGHAVVLSRRGFKFYIIVIDDYSRFT